MGYYKFKVSLSLSFCRDGGWGRGGGVKSVARCTQSSDIGRAIESKSWVNRFETGNVRCVKYLLQLAQVAPFDRWTGCVHDWMMTQMLIHVFR